jgi:hypothetical protein
MKKIKLGWLAALLMVCVFIAAPLLLHAQDVVSAEVVKEVVDKTAQASNNDVIQAVLDFVKEGNKTPLAVAFFLVQAALYFLNAPMSGAVFKRLTPDFKLVIIAVLTAVFGILASLYLGKVGLMTAVTDTTNLYLLKIGLHQIYKKFYSDKNK